MKLTTISVLVLAACSSDLDLSVAEQAGQNLNGQNLNGQNLNGQNLNGQNLNGQNLNGPDNATFAIWTSLDGVSHHGSTYDEVTLRATVFTGRKGGMTRTGTAFAGAHFLAQRGNGDATLMRITSVVPPADGASLWRYHVEYLETDWSWYPICEDASGPLAAIPVDGIWDHRQGVPGGGSYLRDPNKFTFACENVSSIAKCVQMGYAPWQTLDGVPLDDHLAACVRLLRADYCGDGRSFTQDGVIVNLYDALGIEVDTDDWGIEAEWDRDGARCLTSRHRSPVAVPCYDPSRELGCGDPAHFSSGTLLVSEMPATAEH